MQVQLVACVDATGEDIALSFIPATKVPSSRTAEKIATSRIVKAISSDDVIPVKGLKVANSPSADAEDA